MKSLRVLFSLLFLCLLAIPISAHAAERVPVQKSLSSNITTSSLPGSIMRKSLSVNPGDYPLRGNNTYVDSLLDSWYTFHDLTFVGVTNYSASQMDVQVLSQDDSFFKDPYITIEFLKNNGGTLQYINATNFNTFGSLNTMMHSTVNKSLYVGQPYIYLRIGVSEYLSDLYYQDVTQFKVVNPFNAPDKTPPAKPTVNTVDDNDTIITGRAEANSYILVKNGSATVGSTKVSPAGVFSMSMPKQRAGTKLTVYAKDAAGNQSVGTTITVIDRTAPGKPGVSSIGDNQTIINGTAENGSRVEVKQGTSVIGQITSTGSFTIKLTALKKAGTVLTVYAIDKAGNRSAGNAVTVMDVTAPAAPSVNKVTSTSTSITGKAEAGTGVYIFSGSTLVGQATSNSAGYYSAAIPVQKRGIKLEVLAIDKGGNQSGSAWATVY
ncbi:Ig-like domain-containing protein [Neobacillus drentensis]|uniref:Ig-like domain-containing protein n=1 Tax=Neobacillus drentensis TaxID=220684 RepID=UPI001F239228|nr:Ig-like domain-containing protein [Neobacillus drentensis]ULT56790.1 Ig-like domain-containing protein [Neobacillus drentensis]